MPCWTDYLPRYCKRWQHALERAISEGVEVRQLAGCGGWIATSGSAAGVAYELAITGNVAHGCSCPAGANDDPVCKHRARWYFAAGVLDLDPPAPLVTMTRCPDCLGSGYIKVRTGDRFTNWVPDACHQCDSTGEVVARHAAVQQPRPGRVPAGLPSPLTDR